MKCWNCGFENPPNVKFCNNCGAPQQRPCPRCGTTNPPGSKFCNNCGLNLQEAYVAPTTPAASTGTTPASASAQDLIARYMPKDLADKIKEASSRGGMEGERRVATILFCDVKGSTAMAETLDPEEWADIMNRAFRYLIEPVYRYEGTVARLMGDAILAFFGAPIAHEDDPYRAVLASLDILHGIGDYRDRVRRDHGLDFSVRIGLNTGLVVVGNVGSDLKYEYTAMGDAINLASRLQAAAEPDSVMISEYTYHQVSPLVDVVDLGKLQMKGKVDPVRVYKVTGARQGVARTRGLAGLTSPMVDRRREFAALMQTLDDLRAGRGSIVSVIGEAGLGKSRLIAEWHKAVDLHGGEAPIRWVEGRCLSYGASMAHHLSMDVLRSLIGAPAGATEQETRAALRASVDRGLDTDTDDTYPYLAHLLGLSLDEKASAQVRYLDGAALQAKYISAVRSLLQSAARQTPTVIVSEDVQWADPSSVELGLQVLPLAGEVPIVFAFVTRADKEAPGWKLVTQAHEVPGAGAIDLYLAPLSDSDSKQLVSNLLELEELPESARDLILAKAEGNPFFVEEVIRMLIDRGALHREEGRWALSGDIKSIDIPDTLQGVLTARIDRLPEEARRVLQVASVIGRKFPIKVLAAVLETEGLT